VQLARKVQNEKKIRITSLISKEHIAVAKRLQCVEY